MRSKGVDSGYSWVVAVACGMVFSFVNCPMRLGAQLFVSLKDCYGTSRDAASLPFELAFFTKSITGPLAGYFGQKIGLQKVTLIGSLAAATGIFACFFANNIVTVDIFLGLVYGFGYGWTTAVAPEIINEHFVKHRTKGIGVVFGSSGLSAFLTPPLLVFILNTYGEAASFLIMSGVILNAIPAAMLLTKPSVQDASTSRNSFANQKIARKDVDDIETEHKSYKDKLQEKDFFETNNSCTNQTSKFEKTFSKDSGKHIVHNPSFKPIQSSLNVLTSICEKNELDNKNLKLPMIQTQQPPPYKIVELNVNQFSSTTDQSTYTKPNDQTISVRKVESKASKFESINILWSPKFLLIAFIQSSHFYIMYMFWTITVDIVRDKGVENDLEVYFVMALSLFDTIGRFFLASVTDCTSVTSACFSSGCFAIIGLSCLLLVFVSGFEATLAAICLLGLIVGGNTTSLPGIVTDFVEEEKRPLAMASRLILYAPMSFTMSPLIGYFREVLSSYDGLLYVMMSMSFASSIVLQFLSRLHKCNEMK